MKNTARPKTKPPRTKAPRVPVPAQLAGLLALVMESEHADDLGRAMIAARATLRDALRKDYAYEHVYRFVSDEAARGPWKTLHQAFVALERPEDSPLNATAGDAFNVYSIPSVLIGMALAYVYLTEGGAQ